MTTRKQRGKHIQPGSLLDENAGSNLSGNQQPDIIEAILKEKASPSLSASHLDQTLPLDWEGQRKLVAAHC